MPLNKRVEVKISEGDIRGATKLLLSLDSLADQNVVNIEGEASRTFESSRFSTTIGCDNEINGYVRRRCSQSDFEFL